MHISEYTEDQRCWNVTGRGYILTIIARLGLYNSNCIVLL